MIIQKQTTDFARRSIDSRVYKSGSNLAKRCLSLAMLVVVFVAIKGCKEPALPEQNSTAYTQLKKLLQKEQWEIESVTVDGESQTGYEKFTISFSGKPGQFTFNYTVSSPPKLSPWPSRGTLYFPNDQPQSKLVRDKDDADKRLDVNYALSDDKLRMTFEFSGQGYESKFILGVASVKEGNWQFNFK